jgi:hypothetical protein
MTTCYLDVQPEMRCGAGSRGLERVEITAEGHSIMVRILCIFPLILMASVASAQQERKQGHDACARDVSRHCRAHINDGDQVVLECLQQNRAKLGHACAKVLADHGK